MIDPLDSLTFSLHSNKGAYALLLGSGVSRPAGIPTGWEIVLDLIRRLAKIRGEDCEPDPAAWYEAVVNDRPTYSSVLTALALSPLERQQVLRSYVEPTSADRERKLKQPTRAHRAVARLVGSGHVSVILTTNFDRLIEAALTEAGSEPTVVRSADDVLGLPPLRQIACLVVKLHGDYLDPRIKNTTEELARYDKKLDRLLDQILDEYGLIVSGWSALWDHALRAAMARCKSHRFTTYWTHLTQIDAEAAVLIASRRAQVIRISDADAVFETLADRVEALENLDRPHPLSVRLAVETLKTYLVEPRHRIHLEDLMRAEAEATHAALSSLERFPVAGLPYRSDALLDRLRAYDAATERLQHLMATGMAWGEADQRDVWRRVIARIANLPRASGPVYVQWERLRRYPALRLFYAGGIAAIARGRYANLASVMTLPVRSDESNQESSFLLAVDTIHVACWRLRRSAIFRRYSRFSAIEACGAVSARFTEEQALAARPRSRAPASWSEA